MDKTKRTARHQPALVRPFFGGVLQCDALNDLVTMYSTVCRKRSTTVVASKLSSRRCSSALLI
jgi:hypothetical protein